MVQGRRRKNMSAVTVAEPLQHVLQELHIKNAADIVQDYVMTEILCKISDFSQEASFFQEKYGCPLADAKAAYERGDEDFERYDDLMEWEFAVQGQAYWEQQLERLKHVL
ncbi:hypothetical protein GF348_12840 [candidate division KSB3 bacterium]|nr:hypothetical protein [candidate division KSB3 bacterium]